MNLKILTLIPLFFLASPAANAAGHGGKKVAVKGKQGTAPTVDPEKVKAFFTAAGPALEKWALDETPAEPTRSQLRETFGLTGAPPITFPMAYPRAFVGGGTILSAQNPGKKPGVTILANRDGRSLVIDSQTRNIHFIGVKDGKPVVILQSTEHPDNYFASVGFENWTATKEDKQVQGQPAFKLTNPDTGEFFYLISPNAVTKIPPAWTDVYPSDRSSHEPVEMPGYDGKGFVYHRKD